MLTKITFSLKAGALNKTKAYDFTRKPLLLQILWWVVPDSN